ncbi:MAG: FAD-dependent oxidoreductase [bacterium]|nr:FAD-dependent oxidoreductase [bacterium]
MPSNAFSIRIPDDPYWKEQIRCQSACPVHTDARGYVRAIAEGNYEKAYLIARGPNPLASICGRICGAPCEAACRRKDLDEAVSIRALKRFVTSQFGAESKEFEKGPLKLIKKLFSGDRECVSLDNIINYLSDHEKDLSSLLADDAHTVGIIGSGPAGLAAAHDLCLQGIKPVIYEMEPVPAGMLYLGVPEYRLSRDLIKAEVEVIKALGTEIKCNIQIGKDITLDELRKKHSAVLIAVGAKKSRRLPIPNADAEGVIGGIKFLRDAALYEDVNLGKKIIVIGGGNVAYDVARTVVRQTEYDVSRTALRQLGVKEVHLACLESLEEMPADTLEIEEGAEEGVIRHNSLGPTEIIIDDIGKATGVKFIHCISVFDEKGNFSPKFDESKVTELYADSIILAIGQATDLSFIDKDDVELNERNQLSLDNTKTRTNAPDVFAAGDVALGPGLMIDAIASGKQAAKNIYEYITGRKISSKTVIQHSVIKEYERESGFESISREGVPAMPPEERKKSMTAIVETGFSESQSMCQASRCFDCGVNTIFNSERCILCGGCSDVCPEGCLKLISIDRIEENPHAESLIKTRYGDQPLPSSGAIIKDETICIRCGLCAERCPVEAITMERFNFREVIINDR